MLSDIYQAVLLMSIWTKIEFSNVVKCQRGSWDTVSSATGSWQSTGGVQGVQSLKSFFLFTYWGQINSLKIEKT